MSEQPDDESPPAGPHELIEEVAARESRKIHARGTRDRTVWIGLGMVGLVGWSVAVPTLIGIALGLWLDRTSPGPFSWTLALLLAGVTVGCLNAWYWVSQERREIDAERQETR